MTDPIAFLDNAGEDWDIACAVVQRSMEMQNERRHEELKSLVKALGQSVGSEVAKLLGQMFR